jgi:hypothetical protein
MRMLSNSAFAGLLAAVYLTLLLLSLNPSVPVDAASLWRLLAVMTVTYGVHIAVASYALYVLRQIVLAEPSAPGWVSLRLLTWTAAALSGTAGVMTWLHASGLRNALDPRALPALTQAGLLFSAAMAVFLCLAVARAVSRQRRQTVTAILFSFATAASIAAPLMLRRPTIGDHGFARTDMFTAAFNEPRTITFIPTYEPLP